MKKSTVIKLIASAIMAVTVLSLSVGCGPQAGGKETDEPGGTAGTVPPNDGENVGSVVPANGETASYQGKVDVTEMPDLSVSSPDGENKVRIWRDKEGALYYTVEAEKTTIIECSALGMATRAGNVASGITVAADSVKRQEINEKYTTITGPSSEAENHCNEIRFTAKNGNGSFDLVVRVFDDGMALRYENVSIGDSKTLNVTDERTEIVLPEKTTTWGYEPTGTYEGEYAKRSYAQLSSLSLKLSTPVFANSGDYWMLFTEAAVINNNGDFCASTLETKAGSAVLGWGFGVDRDSNDKNVLGELGRPGHFNITNIKTRNGFSTPWRVVVFSDDLEELAFSSIVTDLNPAPDKTLYADTSYIKPGKVAWSWWAEEGEQGNYDKHVEYVDFAAENGWEYVCLDANWRAFEGRISQLCKYAKEKGVGIFVWVNYLDLMDEKSMETLLSRWAKAGVVGIKTDYFESDAQNVLDVMEKTAICAAENKLMVLYHGCVIPYGEFRTYPNIVSFEAVQGEENHKWSSVPTIANCLMYPFTRNICGPMDYTPISMRIVANNSTTAFGLAMPVVYESGLQHLAHAASVYKTYSGLSFLNNLKVTWDESRLLGGMPGEYAALARRSGEDWYIGAMTLRAQSVEYKLDFLGSGEYNAYIYGDNEDGSALRIEERKVTSADTLSFDLLRNGGVAVIVTKRTIDTAVAGAEAVNDPSFNYIEAEDKANVLSGDARTNNAPLCSGMVNVGYIGNGAAHTLTIKVNADKAGKHTLRIWYCCAETRSVTLTINGEALTITGLNSGSWSSPSMKEIEVELLEGENTIIFSNSTAYAPDIDRIAVSKDTVG